MNNFLQMCYSGDLKKIQEHLQSDISILNQTSLTGESPLHIAVKRNNIQLCIILLEKKIDYNAKNFVGLTPLMMSCKYKNPAVTKLLLQQDSIQVNTKDISGKTAPMYAVESNCVSCINLLSEDSLFWTVNWNERDFLQETAPMKALKYSSEELVREILKIDTIDWSIGDIEGYTGPMIAIKRNLIFALKLFENKTDINWNAVNHMGQSVVMIAIENKREFCMKLLTQIKSISWNQQDSHFNTPVIFALQNKSINCLNIIQHLPFIDWNISNINKETALSISLNINDNDFFYILLQKDIKCTEVLKMHNLQQKALLKTLTYVKNLSTSHHKSVKMNTYCALIYALENDLPSIIVEILISGLRKASKKKLLYI